MADVAAAYARLKRSAETTFGPAEATKVSGATAASSGENLSRIDAAQEQLSGDTAHVRELDDPQAQPFTLRNVNGKWMIVMADSVRDIPPAQLDDRIAENGVMAKVINDVAADIEAKTFASVDQAAQSYRSRMLRAAMDYGATTRAAIRASTKPTTKP
jgi:hypothetical protein